MIDMQEARLLQRQVSETRAILYQELSTEIVSDEALQIAD